MTVKNTSPSALIEVFWIEKYLTFSQLVSDELIATDCLFLAEYALRGEASDSGLFEAAVYRNRERDPVATYDGDDALWCNNLWVNRKVQSFDSLSALDTAYPSSDLFHWEVNGSPICPDAPPIRIGGPEGRTDIPKPHAMRLYQDGQRVSDYEAIDSTKELTVEWDAFPGGSAGPFVDDLIFLFVDDCDGKIIYFGGLPVDPHYITYRSTSATIPANSLRPGEIFTIFFSQCRIVDQQDCGGIMSLAVNSFGVELDIKALGEPGTLPPQPRKKAPFMWLRKTAPGGGLETWPTIVDGIHCAPEAVYRPKRC